MRGPKRRQRDPLDRLGQLEPLRVRDVAGDPVEDQPARIVGLVGAVAEPVEDLAALKAPPDPRLGVIGGPDLVQHLGNPAGRTAVDRALRGPRARRSPRSRGPIASRSRSAARRWRRSCRGPRAGRGTLRAPPPGRARARGPGASRDSSRRGKALREVPPTARHATGERTVRAGSGFERSAGTPPRAGAGSRTSHRPRERSGCGAPRAVGGRAGSTRRRGAAMAAGCARPEAPRPPRATGRSTGDRLGAEDARSTRTGPRARGPER